LASEHIGATEIGLVGLGRMGSAIAGRLLECGYALRVYDQDAQAVERAVQRGARAAATPADTAQAGGIVISSVTDAAGVDAICAGEGGLLRTLRGGTHIGMSTLSPQAAADLARRHEEAGVRYVSAPVQGRPAAAGTGQLVGWVSGPRDAQAQAVLEALCRKVFWLSEDAAAGPAAKLAINFLMFGNVALMAEAFAYVERHGIAQQAFAEGLTDTVFTAPFFRNFAAALCAQDQAAQGSDIALAHKDFKLLVGSEPHPELLPSAHRMHEIYQRAMDEGLAELDPAAVRRLFARPA
jgi:3-hydroxyisobutyrate dehydrogenase-like beta-hydroxyacid dehydrogenase